MASADGQFSRGVHCKFTNIEGVKKLVTANGTDIVDFVENFGSQFDKISNVLSDLSLRLSKLEKTCSAPVAAAPAKEDGPLLASLTKRMEAFEKMLESDDLRGPSGPVGPAGPRGPKVDKLHDIKDVCVDGLQDGCVLIRRGDRWVAEQLTEE